MNPNKKQAKANRIPVQFVEDDALPDVEPNGPDETARDEASPSADGNGAYAPEGEAELPQDIDEISEQENVQELTKDVEMDDVETSTLADSAELTEGTGDSSASNPLATSDEGSAGSRDNRPAAGPMLAELLATRAELRRVETERNDLLEKLARRQADFENYRKRIERERGESYQRMVGDVVSKLLPVMDNMRRALEAESLMEKNESAEFRHFLRGVELVNKQLNDVLEELGVEAVPSVGQPFDPHLHEAVATEHSEEYEPDIVTQELLRGYRLGEKLLRPAMVKVSTRQ